MNELFDREGCLTDFALRTLTQGGRLEELERLEIAEHLSFCDRCVARYTALLEQAPLQAPPEPLAPTVWQRVKRQARRIFLNRYATAAAAACFAILFWNLGVFSFDTQKARPFDEMLTRRSIAFSQRSAAFSERVTDTLNEIFQRFSFERGFAEYEKE